jgi:hypothetical protein
MAIPQWITKTANEVSDAASNVTSSTWEHILELQKAGKLPEHLAQAAEEIQSLLTLIDHAVVEIDKGMGEKPMTKMAAPATKEKPKEKEGPLDFGDERLLEKGPEEDDDEEEKPTLPGTVNRKLPPKMKEPETTKWKEIRFNKRTGTWQTVITIRHTRNFLSEDEAVEFTKKASKE